MQTHGAQTQLGQLGHCRAIDASGYLRLRLDACGTPVTAWIKSDVDLTALQHHVRVQGPVLVTQATQTLWLVTALLHAPARVLGATAGPTVLRADAIELGGGAARIWAEGRTLHLRAFHMHLRAQGQQRLTGATIAVG